MSLVLSILSVLLSILLIIPVITCFCKKCAFQAVLKQFAGYTGSQGPDVFADEVDLKRHQQLERLYISTRAGKVWSDWQTWGHSIFYFFENRSIILFLQHFQREIVRGIEGFISTGSKQLEVCAWLISTPSPSPAIAPPPPSPLPPFLSGPHKKGKWKAYVDCPCFHFAATKLSEDCCKYASEGPNSTGALARASSVFGNSVLQMEKERETLHRALGTQVMDVMLALVVVYIQVCLCFTVLAFRVWGWGNMLKLRQD